MSRLLLAAALLLPRPASAQDTLDPAVAADLLLTQEVTGLAGPTSMAFLPDGRLVVTEQGGDVRLWDGNNLELAGTITTNAGGERGLLGVAVDPMFAQSNRLYFYFSQGTTQRVAWTTLDPATSELDTANLTTIIQDLSANRNHNGGGMAFGPDDNLYLGVGDTGCNCTCDPGTNENNYSGTCLTRYHGKVLRIDRDGAAPANNPLVGVTSAPACAAGGTGNTCAALSEFPSVTADPLDEIWLWGFRNPWRLSFDSRTGFLWIGDVGEVSWEEITISRVGGEHHGWPLREGFEGQDRSVCPMVVPQSSGDCVDPAFAYTHDEQPAFGSGSVSGGVFSNHCSWPAAYNGLYWFGDFNKARVWTLTPNAARDGVDGERQIIVRSAAGAVTFAEASDGSIWYASVTEGEIWKIAPAVTSSACGVSPDAGVVEDGGGGGMDATPGDAMEGDTGMAGNDAAPGDQGVASDSGNNAQKDAGGVADTGTGGDEDDDCGCTTTHRRQTSSVWIVLGLIALSLSSSRARRDRRTPAGR